MSGGRSQTPAGFSVCQNRDGDGRLMLADLPDWDWYDISVHLARGKVGWSMLVWTGAGVINFAKGVPG